MAIYIIGDLHLSFSTNKPMNIFGKNWENHEEKIKEDWEKRVNNLDTVIIPGDLSWATYLEDTYRDFEFVNNLPGKKILLKGNHDYWWTTVTNMKRYLKENNFNNIDFLYNNSFLIEDKIVCGTRGWINTTRSKENDKILKRENDRLKISLNSGIEKFGTDKEIIVFLHYPPFNTTSIPEEMDIIKTMEKYNVKKCFYGHIHSDFLNEATEGNINGIEYRLISSDYINFNLVKLGD